MPLFVREFKSDRLASGAEAHTYLGAANHAKYGDSRPMNIDHNLTYRVHLSRSVAVC